MIQFKVLNYYLIDPKIIYKIEYTKNKICYHELYEILSDKISEIHFYYDKDIKIYKENEPVCINSTDTIELSNDIIFSIFTIDNSFDDDTCIKTCNNKIDCKKCINCDFNMKLNSFKKITKKLKIIQTKFNKRY